MKLVFISSMLPSGHFSQIICSGLAKVKNLRLIVYTDQNQENLNINNCGEIKPVWSKSPRYVIEILRQLLKDKPDVVHIQQELNMYGGTVTVLLFPWLILAMKLMGIPKVVTTIHASVFKKQIDQQFVETFHKDPKVFKPFMLSWFFQYLFFLTSLFTDEIILHSPLSKEILVEDYFIDSSKVTVIKTPIPDKKVENSKKKKYFFYFGYMVRRKGLEHLIRGFKSFIDKNPDQKFDLVLAGGVIKGQEKALDEIKELISDLELDKKIKIVGYIEEEEQDKLYREAYAVVIPAVLSMGSSGPLYHAFSYAKCVIATKMGHFLCDIKNMETGILTFNNDWDRALHLGVSKSTLVTEIEANVLEEKLTRTPYKTALKYLDVYKKQDE